VLNRARLIALQKGMAGNGRWQAKRKMNEVAEERQRVLGDSLLQVPEPLLRVTRDGQVA
jgi:hypothetical protein